MKKLLYLLLVISLMLFLAGCGEKKAADKDEMLEIIAEDLDLDTSIQIIDIIELDDVTLVCYITGTEYQAHSYGYAEFEKQNNNYKFVRTYSMIERGMDLRSALYNDSYLFVSNNENCKSLRIRFQDGQEEIIQVDKIPFVYYLENITNFEYYFLDKNKKELAP